MDSKVVANNVRISVLKMINKAHASHIASCFSIVDILSVLYTRVLKYDTNNPNWSKRDKFVLSKGHAGAALYATLAEVGFFDKKVLESYDQPGSVLSGHVSHKGVPGVEISTGSLGHGICVATGFALAAKVDKSDSQVYVIVGDGECNEGCVWETIMVASQFNLDNITYIVDSNKLQAMGSCKDIMDLSPLSQKFEAFGCNVIEIDGHDYDKIYDALTYRFNNGKPKVIIANTIKGKGVSFMENNLLWHYRDPQGEFFEKALAELEDNKNA